MNALFTACEAGNLLLATDQIGEMRGADFTGGYMIKQDGAGDRLSTEIVEKAGDASIKSRPLPAGGSRRDRL